MFFKKKYQLHVRLFELNALMSLNKKSYFEDNKISNVTQLYYYFCSSLLVKVL